MNHQSFAGRSCLTSFTFVALPWVGCVLVLLFGCSGPTFPIGVDPASADAGAWVDAGAPVDAGSQQGDGGKAQEEGGGAPIDAGALPDGGPADVVDGGAEACPVGAIFCESFENGIDEGRWRIHGDAQTFSVDNAVARDGHGSLHMAYGAPSGHTGRQSLEIVPAIPAPLDRIYLRTYLRFGDLSLPGQHPAFIDVIDKAAHEVGFGSIINDFALLGWVPGSLDNARIWYEGNGQWHSPVQNGDSTPGTENGLLAQRWFCLELMYFGDHQGPEDTSHDAEEVRVWIDGKEIAELAATDALWAKELGHAPPEHWSPVYDNASWRFGVESFGPTSVALDVWFDAIVFSPTRVGCLQ